jgi:hypothetical protein
MYGTVCPPSAFAQIDGWSIGEGVARLFGAAPVEILSDAEASTLGIGHVLADAAPEFAAAALRAIAERHHIGKARAVFDHDLAELTALWSGGFAQG